MGKNTYISINKKYKPLQDRINIILSKNSNIKDIEPKYK